MIFQRPTYFTGAGRTEKVIDIGQCIYCRSSEDLSREHVVPKSLGGDLILRNATCGVCKGRIGEYEEKLIRSAFQPIRDTRRIKSYSPLRQKSAVRVRRHGCIETDSVSVADHPGDITFPSFPPPGLLVGRDRLEPWPSGFNQTYFRKYDNKAIRDTGAEKIVLGPEFSLTWFARFIAKVSHGFAVATLGIDGFKPYLLDTIVQGAPSPTFFIGSLGRRLPSRDGFAHEFSIHPLQIAERMMAVARLRFFQDLGKDAKQVGPPHYIAAVGEITDPRLLRGARLYTSYADFEFDMVVQFGPELAADGKPLLCSGGPVFGTQLTGRA